VPERAEDWLSQAERDLEHARHAREAGHHEWACFAAQQAAEEAVKGLFQKLGADAWGHSVFGLLQSLPEQARPPERLYDLARTLDRHYVGTRYPNAHPEGPPYRYYTREDADRALSQAEEIVGFCAGHVSGPGSGPEGPG